MPQTHSDIANTVRLMDIVLSLSGDDKCYPDQNLPYAIDPSGSVTLSTALYWELSKHGNQDLVPWAHKNIMGLFKEGQ